MTIDSPQTLDQLAPVIKASLGKSFERWREFHRGRLAELESILNPLKILLVHAEEWAEKPAGLWHELETQMTKVKLWTLSIQYIHPDDFDKKITEPLSSELDTLLAEFPDEIFIPIDKSYWQVRENDSLIRQLRKKWQPLKIRLIKNIHNLINQYRRIRHLPPLKSRSDTRTIQLKNLVNYFIKIPILKFQIDEWQRYLQVVTGQLFVLQLNLKEFTTKSLILDKLPVILEPDETNDIFSNLFELAEVLKNVDETLQALHKYEQQYFNRFEETWYSICTKFSQVWYSAGTFQLKNKRYSGDRLANYSYAIASRFKKYSTAWSKHFDALQGEWKKDSEISLLRYKTISNLFDTNILLYQGIQKEIKPHFISASELLKKTSAEIDKISDNESFIQLIGARRKAILNVLQVLLETIHGVNIVRLSERLLYVTQSAVEAISKQHLLFKYQDTERRPPRSIMENIPLKELIKNELFTPYKERLASLTNKNESVIEHVLRVISEIDQLIEFNCDSTLKLINQSGDMPVFKRGRNEMSEGLERALKLLTDLRELVDQIPVDSKNLLLENSLEFEKNLDRLLDSERLFKFKSQLRRKSARNRLDQLVRGAIDFLKSLFPSLLKKIRGGIRKLWIKYFSTHPQVYDHQEPDMDKIRQYLNETESRIARLPFIYQKLFHFQSLNDNQFFTNRVNEIAMLKTEFESWQNGQPSSIAVTGERGSGLTTFLNYAENQIFKNGKIIRIIFSRPENSEATILKLVSNAFNLHPSANWTELEKKLREEKKSSICMVENLQYMYLKTVSGFEGLEHFLQLISATKDVIFWLSTCTLYSWQFLEKAISINSYYNRLLRLHKISPDELKSIILKRHRASGYHLEFESSAKSSLRKKPRKKDNKPQQLVLEDIYFRKLHNIAGGNITTAILIWLRSIKEFSQEKMVLSTRFEFDFSFLDQLPHDKLLTLGAVLHHEKLSPESHAAIFSHPFDRSRLMLESLETEGLLMRNGDGFQIHPFLYRPLVRSLNKKHIVS